MSFYKKNHKGFTLIELLTIISIIGLISTLMIVAFNKVRMKSRDVVRLHEAKQIMNAFELYNSDHDIYPCEELTNQGKMCFIIFGGKPFTEDTQTMAIEVGLNGPPIGLAGCCYVVPTPQECIDANLYPTSPECDSENQGIRNDIIQDIAEYMNIPADPLQGPLGDYSYFIVGPCTEGTYCKIGNWCDAECQDVINNPKFTGKYIIFITQECSEWNMFLFNEKGAIDLGI